MVGEKVKPLSRVSAFGLPCMLCLSPSRNLARVTNRVPRRTFAIPTEQTDEEHIYNYGQPTDNEKFAKISKKFPEMCEIFS